MTTPGDCSYVLLELLGNQSREEQCIDPMLLSILWLLEFSLGFGG